MTPEPVSSNPYILSLPATTSALDGLLESPTNATISPLPILPACRYAQKSSQFLQDWICTLNHKSVSVRFIRPNYRSYETLFLASVSAFLLVNGSGSSFAHAQGTSSRCFLEDRTLVWAFSVSSPTDVRCIQTAYTNPLGLTNMGTLASSFPSAFGSVALTLNQIASWLTLCFLLS